MGSVVLTGATSGSTTITPTDAVTATITLPSTTGTLGFASGSATQSFNAQNTFGFKNRIINGAQVIDQRNAGASVTASTTGAFVYTLDRWNYYADQASKFTVQQNAGSITPPVGFSNYLGVTSTAATTVTTSQAFLINQFIEGFNTSDLGWGTANAKTVTLSFWVYSSLTGTFGGALTNSAGNYSYPFSYTVSSANTWTQISITIAGPTSGTWVGSTNGIGVKLNFSLGTGSSSSGTAGSWSANSYFSATGAVSVVSTSGATFYITGVQLEVGTQATSFDFRSYSTELQKCWRYYQNYTFAANAALGTGIVNSTSSANAIFSLTQPMRATPSLTIPATGTSSGQITFTTSTGGFPSTIGTINAQQASPTSFMLSGTGFTASFVAGNTAYLYNNGGVSLSASAEL